MEKTKFVTFTFTQRRIEMSVLVLNAALQYMQDKKSATTDPAEAAFYERQAPEFQALVELLTKAQLTAGKAGATCKVRLTQSQLLMLTGTLGQHNLAEAVAASKMDAGAEKDKRLKALDEWSQLREALEAKDPRKYDTSQDAEDEEEEEEPEADE